MNELANETNIVKNKGFSKINLDLPFIEKCGICCDNPVQIKKENFDDSLKSCKFVDSNDKESLKNYIFKGDLKNKDLNTLNKMTKISL